MTQPSTLGDYRLRYFFERLGAVTAEPAARRAAPWPTRTPSGARGRSAPPHRTSVCVLFPEREDLAIVWHPLLARVSSRVPNLAWYDHPIFEPQEPEEWSLTGMSYDLLARSVLAARTRDPKRTERFFVELREEFDEVRGTTEAKEYARALPLLETSLPADLWQLHFGDIDPTPVDLVMRRVKLSPPAQRWRARR